MNKPNLLCVFWTACMLLSCIGLDSTYAAVPSQYTKKPTSWFQTDEGRRIANNVVTWQTPIGSWPKNGDTASKPNTGDSSKLKGTFDNSATTGELKFLATAYRATQDTAYREAFYKGVDLLLRSQYPTGGWPQTYPPSKKYDRHITLNDNTMVRIMELLHEVAKSEDYNFVSKDRREAAQVAFDKGIDFFVKAQVVVDGKRTVWCAQHDEVDLQPRPARAFELVSLSGAESGAVLKLLMSLEQPSAEVRQAIESGIAWFEEAKITGIRVESSDDDTVVVKDANASPVWARFYEIETNRPFFCGRDGIKRYELREIEAERRAGYTWYGTWGHDMEKRFKKWKEKWSSK